MDQAPLFSIQGHLLKLGDAREVALYRRDGTLWAADFIDGRCEIVEAARWFATRDGARALARARRRHAQRVEPISSDLAETIECLHFILAPHHAGRPTGFEAAAPRAIRASVAAEIAQPV